MAIHKSETTYSGGRSQGRLPGCWGDRDTGEAGFTLEKGRATLACKAGPSIKGSARAPDETVAEQGARLRTLFPQPLEAALTHGKLHHSS